MAKQFELTQFHARSVGVSYFVKLHSERFSQSELAALRALRSKLFKKFPQHKSVKAPASWRLRVETCDGAMTGWLDITLPDGRIIEWDYVGTTEEVCTELGNSLDANPMHEQETRTLPSGRTFTRNHCRECGAYWDTNHALHKDESEHHLTKYIDGKFVESAK